MSTQSQRAPRSAQPKSTQRQLAPVAPQAKPPIITPAAKKISDTEKEHLDAFLSPEESQNLSPKLHEFLKKTIADLRENIVTSDNHDRIIEIRNFHDGDKDQASVICLVNKDRPFLLSSTLAVLHEYNLTPRFVTHPLFAIGNHKAKAKLEIFPAEADTPATQRLSFIVIVTPEINPDRKPLLENSLRSLLKELKHSVDDWPDMRKTCNFLRVELETQAKSNHNSHYQEYAHFLNWLDEGNFIFLGYRFYHLKREKSDMLAKIEPGLGILRSPKISLFRGDMRQQGKSSKIRPLVAQYLLEADDLRISKSSCTTAIHRPGPMDIIHIKSFNNAGDINGEHVFCGLFSSAAYTLPPEKIPLLRNKIASFMKKQKPLDATHNARTLKTILASYPRDELFQITNEQFSKILRRLLALHTSSQAALVTRRDHLNRYISCLVYIPQRHYHEHLRLTILAILQKHYQGKITQVRAHFADGAWAQLSTLILKNHSKNSLPDVDAHTVEAEIASAARPWSEKLAEHISKIEDCSVQHPKVQHKIQTWGRSFSTSYRSTTPVETTVQDIALLERAQKYSCATHMIPTDEGIHLRLALPLKTALPLSDLIPMLENLGLRTLNEQSFLISETQTWQLHAFDSVTVEPHQDHKNIAQKNSLFEKAFKAIWRGQIENDRLNRLVLTAGLGHRPIHALRAYTKFLLQSGMFRRQGALEDALLKNAQITRLLADMIYCHNAPEIPERSQRFSQLHQRVHDLRQKIKSLNHDQILHYYAQAIAATLRCNLFLKHNPDSSENIVALKFDSKALSFLPEPRPHREAFIYGTDYEALHLRFSQIARGGIRWSNRHDDLRSEILELAKTQQVKNAGIVPRGAKGGFVLKKNISPESQEWKAQGIACYQSFLRALLSLSDNRVEEKNQPTDTMVCHDRDDPYLVVAADKGTAAFSDIANSISLKRGFWLSDAFASGGSEGYDHKKMGITARGAWVSVAHHFHKLGRDINRQPFSCIGIGDMAGDVFGNAALLSPMLCLEAAFNHQHIFIDPNPDPERTWHERQRLFHADFSGWDHYDPQCLSRGGGVFLRDAKKITITPEMRQRFGWDVEQMTPDETIRALLTAKVDLLWFGGIGTFIKSTDESHHDVGDHANDAIRVNAQDLNARILGEGANLGITKRGRVAYALCGGITNGDFIDNSAGVDCSDHEVNIKILCASAEHKGQLTRARRNQLLSAMSDEVAQLVLNNNYEQNIGLSVGEFLGVRLLDRQARCLRQLENQHHLMRTQWGLPQDETIVKRAKTGTGLSRPELAILNAFSKLALSQEFIDGNLPDDPAFDPEIIAYFPKRLHKKFAKEITQHPLRQELISGLLANEIVNRCGMTFIPELKEKTDASSIEIARAYFIASRSLLGAELWKDIAALGTQITTDHMNELLLIVGRFITTQSERLLSCSHLELTTTLEKFHKGCQDTITQMHPTWHQDPVCKSKVAQFKANGVPNALSWRLAFLGNLEPIILLLEIADSTACPLQTIWSYHKNIAERLHLPWFKQAISALPSTTSWTKRAITELLKTVDDAQARLTQELSSRSSGKTPSLANFEAWKKDQNAKLERLDFMYRELKSLPQLDFPALTVAVSQLTRLLARI